MKWDAARATEARLWDLIGERGLPGADHETLDRRIWDLYGEEATVLCTSLAGMDRQVAAVSTTHFLGLLLRQRSLLWPIFRDRDGALIRSDKDVQKVVFRSAGQALLAALEMQNACATDNDKRDPEEML
ncbi:MAG: hypothetical protein KC416_07620, partial [Myxococcales bacterium]|nr:hypothetical protein [Myxococcales bacterium]